MKLKVILLFSFLAMSSAAAGPDADLLTNPNAVAKAASALSVLGNVCQKYFSVDLKELQKLQGVLIKQGRLNSRNFETLFRQEVERRYAEVITTGDRDWCMAKRKDYEERGIITFGRPVAQDAGERSAKSDDQIVEDAYRKAQQQGKTPQQFADELLRQSKPVRRTKEQLESAAFTAASSVALETWCKVTLTYGERVDLIVITAQAGGLRVAAALSLLEDRKKDLGASEFCLGLEKSMHGDVK
jgi:hypothetical protein